MTLSFEGVVKQPLVNPYSVNKHYNNVIEVPYSCLCETFRTTSYRKPAVFGKIIEVKVFVLQYVDLISRMKDAVVFKYRPYVLG